MYLELRDFLISKFQDHVNSRVSSTRCHKVSLKPLHIYSLEDLAATAPGTAALQSLVGASAGDALGSAGSGLETYPKTVASVEGIFRYIYICINRGILM